MQLFTWPGMESLAQGIQKTLGFKEGTFEWRHFPDGESYVRIITMPDKEALILCSLDHPDEKLMPLIFLADTLRAYGAERIGLIAPYLCYLRQDARFNEGEALTSQTCATLLSRHVDWLITVEPHLHRYHELSEIYTIPTKVVKASTAIASWIKKQIDSPLIVGPDEESIQFIVPVAELLKAPYLTMKKTRYGDRNVKISAPDVSSYKQCTPVLVDDIISSGRTLIEAAEQLHRAGLKKSLAIAVHALCEEDVIKDSALSQLVTTNTIPHSSNAIDLSSSITDTLRSFLA